MLWLESKGLRRHRRETPPLFVNNQPRRELRRRLRKSRRAVSGSHRQRSETLIARRVARLPVYKAAACIAVYLSFDGEVDLSELMKTASMSGKALVLPVIRRRSGSGMCFRRYRPGDPVRYNRFGIREPCLSDRRRIRPSSIDLVLMPVVGFDASGTRLGMGGGFYDRYFARLAKRPGLHHRLVGVAFECQKVERLQRHAWDIPMTAVVTETRIYRSAGALKNGLPDREENK